MEPYRNFKSSIDYRLMTSIDFYRLELLHTLTVSASEFRYRRAKCSGNRIE